MSLKIALIIIAIVPILSVNSIAAPLCSEVFHFSSDKNGQDLASYNEVLEIMNYKPYNKEQLPIIPLQMWKWFGKTLSFFVGKRSFEILQDKKINQETIACSV